jgi:hypothetical protein
MDWGHISKVTQANDPCDLFIAHFARMRKSQIKNIWSRSPSECHAMTQGTTQ